MNRVAITAVGIVSPFGRGPQATLDALRDGSSGIRHIRSFDASALNCRIAGEVPPETLSGTARGQDRFTRLALLAAADAALAAGAFDSAPERVGVILGTGLGGCETLDAAYHRLYGENARVAPTSIPSSMYNAAAAAISNAVGARGISFAVSSACASSAHAIGLAFQMIRSGGADAILTGGADAPLTFGIVRAWEALRVLAIDNERPENACRPFSADRKGIVLAEGAAVLVLESLERARRRGAEILGEIVGFGATSDAGHVTDPSSDGAARSMSGALESAALNPSDVGYINAHGTATRANDSTETTAIRAVFGSAADSIPVSSTKSMHGHAMGASGAVEIVSSLLALNDGFLPPTINLAAPDPACDLDYVPNTAREGEVDVFLSNSFGFGGMNATIAVRTRRAV